MAAEVDPSCNPVDLVSHEACNPGTVYPGSQCQSEPVSNDSPRTISQPPQPTGDDFSKFDIIKATQYGAFERCRELLDAGYDVNQRDQENVTLLHWAAINNRKEIIKYYISKGAVVDALGGELMSTPLHWATRQGHLSMVVLLMQYGADPSLRDGEGCSCIHLAAQFGHTAIVAYLIAKGQNVNMVDRNGMTPLMWAVYRILAFGLADYADYLRIKALRNVTITSYINEFPGMVHFIYVNRMSNQVIVPTMDDGSAMRLNNTNLSTLIKEKVNQMVEFTRTQLQLGHFAIVWRDSHFHYSYFLWFEDLKGESLKPQVLLHGLRNFPPPGILSGDFYKMLRRECFPSLSPDDIHCYELLCIHLATASPPFIVEHVRRLAATIWDLCGAAQSPVDLL